MPSNNRDRRKVWLRRGVEALVLVALVAGVRAWQHRDVVSGTAPSLRGALIDGTPYALSSAPSQPVLVHFWATWCQICGVEQGVIENISHDHAIITVAMQSGGRDEVAGYLRDQHLSFPVLNDPDGQISAAWGVHAVPTSFVVDRSGKIRFVEIGYSTSLGLQLRLWLAAALS